MKPGVSRRFVLGSLALVAGQSVLSRRVAATDDPPRPIVPVYARATAVKPGYPSLEVCGSGEGNYLAYVNLQSKLPSGYVFEASSLRFSFTEKCPPTTDANAPESCPESCEVEHRSIFCRSAHVECTKFQLRGSGRGITRAGARRRALRDLEAGLDKIGKTVCDCGCLKWENN
jgi:hypothetical protein